MKKRRIPRTNLVDSRVTRTVEPITKQHWTLGILEQVAAAKEIARIEKRAAAQSRAMLADVIYALSEKA